MSTKHTPGPWVTGNTDPLMFGRPQGNGTEPIGFVYGPSHAELSDHGLECLANARLAAAAPTLLVALQALVDMADSEGLICGPMLINEARAAIAKATGSAS